MNSNVKLKVQRRREISSFAKDTVLLLHLELRGKYCCIKINLVKLATGNSFKQKTGGGYLEFNKPSISIDPDISGNQPCKLGLSLGGYCGADLGGYTNRK